MDIKVKKHDHFECLPPDLQQLDTVDKLAANSLFFCNHMTLKPLCHCLGSLQTALNAF